MGYIWICPLLGFVVAAISTRAALAIAKRANLYDKPGPLKIHDRPIPRLGGVGIMLGLLVATAPWLLTSGKSLISGVLLLLMIWALGLADDLSSLPSILRLVVQLGVGAGLWIAGWRLQFSGSHLVDLAFTAFLFALFVNSMNLLDGMDGLATGIAAIAAAGFVILSPQNSSVALLAACFLGACLGALVFNFPPARIFIGDSGSTLLGAILFFLTLDLARSNPGTTPPAIGLLVVALPLVDTLFAILRRVRGGGSPFSGDRFHYYDLLLSKGLSVRQVLSVSYPIGACLVFLACLCVRGALNPTATCCFVLLAFTIAGYSIGSFSSLATEARAAVPVRALPEKPTAEA
jgi:UDP-GlcNAc:undecaprenyl-phosphate/decaprenyl-phosphate GlcNAc-1-phosphate transferase